MNQADDGSSSRDPSPSTGQNAQSSPQLAGVVIPAHGAFRSMIAMELGGPDYDRLIAIGNRCCDMQRVLGMLSMSEDLNDDARSVVGMAMREFDAIATIAWQPSQIVAEYIS